MSKSFPALQLIKCFGLPHNLPIVFTEVSRHFSLFDNLSVNKSNIQPCILIIREANTTNSIFTIGCNEQHINFVKKYIDSAELYVDNFKFPQKNWLIKLSLNFNQKNFFVEILFNLNLMQKKLEVSDCKTDVDDFSNLQLVIQTSPL